MASNVKQSELELRATFRSIAGSQNTFCETYIAWRSRAGSSSLFPLRLRLKFKSTRFWY